MERMEANCDCEGDDCEGPWPPGPGALGPGGDCEGPWRARSRASLCNIKERAAAHTMTIKAGQHDDD